MKKTGLLAALLAAGFISAGALGADSPLKQLLEQRPGVQAFEWNGKISRLYGAPMSTGSDVEASAWSFLQQHAAVFGASLGDLVQVSTADGLAYQPVMYNPNTGDYKFMAVYFGQVRENVSVFDSNLTLVVRNDRAAGFPVVLAVNNLKDISSFVNPLNVMTPADIKNLRNRQYPAVGEPDRVIYVDENVGERAIATLAYTYVSQTGAAGMPISIGINGEPMQGSYDKRRLIVDAVTGRILFQESLIHSFDDVTGNVTGKATPGVLPDRADNLPVDMALPDVTVQIIGGNSANTDIFGDFVIPHGGSQQVTVRSRMVGPALLGGVNNQGSGGALLLDQIVTPPGPANFLQNPTPSEYLTSQVNAMLQTAMIHSRVLEINPDYPQAGRTFTANVNINSSCNAYYDGPSINFYRVSGGCENTAYSTVVHHEYGHKLVGDAGTNQGAYGEGMGDVMGIVMTESPITGEDFFSNGGDIRDARDMRRYPCSGEIHYCGQILSGCAYFTQEALRLTEPSQYRNILGDLALNSILFRPSGIDPGITIDWLTLDDDDNNIANGTPHYREIDEGFTPQNMAPPPLILIEFSYPNGRPDQIQPDGGTTFRVEVSAANGQPLPGTGMLHYDDGSGWNAISMNQLQDNVYDATFPATTCGNMVHYYLSAETTDHTTVSDPYRAPDSSYSAFSARNLTTYLVDNFETDMGWTVQNENLYDGAWERGVPAGSGGTWHDPLSDFDGSGRCFLTGNRPGDSDVDGGPTRLISPTIDMTAGDATVRYARWYVDALGGADDRFTVDISNDNGSHWTNVENLLSQGEEWIVHEFRVSDYVNPTATMKLRFSAVDNPNNSALEAGIDAVQIFALDCGDYALAVRGTCPGTVEVAWSNAEPAIQQGILFGSRLGSTTIPNGPCQGTVIGIAGSVQLVRAIGTGSGTGSINGQASAGACGHYLQLIQAGSCVVSNSSRIPN